MRLLPRSLFGRSLLLIALLILLGQLGGALLARRLILEPRLEQIAAGVAHNATALRASLLALPPAQRTAFVARFNAQALAGHSIAGGDGPPTPLPPLERNFARRLAERLAGDGLEVHWLREAGGGPVLRLRLEGEDLWLAVPGILPERLFTGTWLFASLGAGLLALAGALAIQRRLNRPLTRVVLAAECLGRGGEPEPLAEDGPEETASLSRSFNRLRDSLARNERERALMLAGLSHDLRTPLAKLSLGVEILAGRDEPEVAASLRRSIAEMDALVGQFLDFARDSREEPAVVGELDVLARELAAAYADHGQLLLLEPGAPPPVRMHPAALRRALTNLLENAWRHGRPPVRLRTGMDGDCAWLEVIDSGAGLGGRDAEALKQAFRRGENARGGAPGAGLGLAIAERIAREHGGRLELSERPGPGLRARIGLPLHRG
ncbi:ATP-binding protein [Azotobacter chroococcum]|uniref:histidine kinase n=1 Tax=Azotobacter chroococcum NCIMB 8003 TaxID=1328314 RepID=A0A0C4WGD9_9GAMM|nr:ATP-binding protein [Azotobacter chroococcum]AJE20003.1 Integral membrane sensor signal transduction histidine kinase [Azotobacter chroococcum NCIMB 8003]